MMLGLLKFRRDPLKFLEDLVATQGDLARFRVGPQWVFVLNQPDAIREVLVTQQRQFVKGGALQRAKAIMGEGLLTSEGELHQRQRRLIQPAFHRQAIGGHAQAMATFASRLGERWQDGRVFDVWQDMMHLTLAIVGKTLFDADVEADAQAIEEAINDLLALFDTITLPFFHLLLRLPTRRNRLARAALARLDLTIGTMIADRRQRADPGHDLLGMLLAARDPEAVNGMSDSQLRDEVITLFLAGHETTANALTWTWYLLACHPTAEAALHEELDRVLGGRAPTLADLPALAITERIFAESLRLYPPGWAIGRRAIAPVKIGEWTLPTGAIVLVSPYLMHRNPVYHTDPLLFDPGRHTPEARAARPQFSYFPFGGGPRGCVGEPFAWMEGVLVLATLAQRWRLSLVPGHPVAPQPLVTLRPRHGVQVVSSRRI